MNFLCLIISSASNAFILVMKKLTKVASLKSKLFEQIKSQGVVTEPYQVLNPVKWRIYKVFEAKFEENLLQMLHGNKVYSDHCQVKSHTQILFQIVIVCLFVCCCCCCFCFCFFFSHFLSFFLSFLLSRGWMIRL